MRFPYALPVCVTRMRLLYVAAVCGSRMRFPYALGVCVTRLRFLYEAFV